MPDRFGTELERNVPRTLKAIEGKSYSQLPQELHITDKGLMTSFRNLSGRTRDTKREWSGYLTKDRLGNLTLGHISAGTESASQAVVINDLTGLRRIAKDDAEYNLWLKFALDGELWRSEDSQRPMLVLGRDLEIKDKSLLHKGVIVTPGEEFFGLVHTHLGSDAHSPEDFFMVAEQQFRPDGRPQMPLSIVIGPEDFYALVVPTDGVVRNSGPYGAPTGLLESLNFGRDITDTSSQGINQKLLNYLEQNAHDRQFGFYQGKLSDGVLKRLV